MLLLYPFPEACLSVNLICILVHGWIKETARVDNLVIPQHAGWINRQWLHDTNVKYKALKLGDNSETS